MTTEKNKQKPEPMIVVHGIPHNVLAYVKSHYPEGKIIDMVEDEDKHNDVKYIDVDVVDKDNTYHIRFDKKGKFIHEEIEIGKIENEEGTTLNEEIEEDEPTLSDEPLEEI